MAKREEDRKKLEKETDRAVRAQGQERGEYIRRVVARSDQQYFSVTCLTSGL